MVYEEAIEQFPIPLRIIIKRIHNRIESGKNALICIAGPTGSGKSLVGCQLMRGLYLYRHGIEPTVPEMMRHIFFKNKPFVEAMMTISGKLVETSKHEIEKQCWLYDDVTEIGNKTWQSTQNRVMGWLVQTFRNLQQVVIFTIPSMGMLDKTVRNMLHYYIETESLDKSKKICLTKPLQLEYNLRQDELYYHNFTWPDKEQGIMEVDKMGVPKIPDDFELEYEKMANKFKHNLNKKIINLLEQGERKEIKNNDLGISMTCQHCGYDWNTKSKALLVCCPSCHKTTKRKSAREQIKLSTQDNVLQSVADGVGDTINRGESEAVGPLEEGFVGGTK